LQVFEILYTFDLPAAFVREQATEADKDMAGLASAYWIAFATNGDPNGAGRPE
jgi:para-nitrobenzyl esterase